VIFGRMSNNGMEFVLVGLSDANLQKMKEGKPLVIGPNKADPVMERLVICLICGETEKDMLETLKTVGLVTPDNSINDML
jgi:hypothetical protein